MGRAERLKGKTLDDRIQFAHQRAEEETARIKALAVLMAEQEIQAWKIMVWWQIEMTIERDELYQKFWQKKRMKQAMFASVLAGTIYSGLGGIYHGPRR